MNGNVPTTHQVFDYEKDEPLRLSIKTTDDTNRSVVASVILPIEDDLMEDGDGDGLSQAGRNWQVLRMIIRIQMGMDIRMD